ncbi:MAG: hypothetical protein Q7W55_02375 [Pseudohongiella sp.]|nr:hypothetical protein [Pseudohongiella sp.]
MGQFSMQFLGESGSLLSAIQQVWRLFFLSSGERPLTEHAALSGNPAHAGAELRMVDINAGTRKFRAFDNTHEMTGEAFHRALSVAVTNSFGQAGPALIEALLKGKDKEEIPALYGTLRLHFDSGSAQAGRVADRFCAVATAGEYAIGKGVLPWRKGTVLSACKKLFGEWLETVGNGNSEDRQILQGIADFIAAHGDSRFSSLREVGDSPRSVHNRAGYYDQPLGVGDRVYFFTLPAIKEAAKGFSKERILLALKNASAIEAGEVSTGNKWNQVQKRLPGGGRGWFYQVNPEKLQSAN